LSVEIEPEPAAPKSGSSPPKAAAPPRDWLFLLLLFAAGVVVFFPALTSPFLFDDYAQTAMIDGRFPVPRAPWNLYDFVNDADRELLLARGIIPWWSDPNLVVRFLRPVSSVLLWADHYLWGVRPLPQHLHSFVWWAAAVLAAHALFRRQLARWPGRIATAIFALAPCHAGPLAWLANREALVSLAFGTLALHTYLRWRETGARRFVAAATLLFTLALLAGEYGLCFGGYVLAIELVDPAPRAGAEGSVRGLVARAARFWPFAAPAAAYLIAHRRLGYGVIGSSPYADPFNARMTKTFLQLAPRRFANLLARAWLTLDDAAGLLVVGGSVALLLLMAVVIALLVRRTAQRLDEPSRTTVAWAAPGALLVLVPALAVIPGTRMLGTTMLGVSALVAVVFSEAWASLLKREAGGLALPRQLAGLALGAAHLVHGPMAAWAEGARINFVGWACVVRVTALDERLRSSGARDIVVLRGTSFYVPFALQPPGGVPTVRFLSQTGHVLALRRDARTVDLVAPPGSGVVPAGFANLFQDASTRVPAAGDVVRLPGLTVTTLEPGPMLIGPRVVRFEFAKDLESSGALWVTEDLVGFRDVVLPKPGFGVTFDL
jgi:hypothetical protein